MHFIEAPLVSPLQYKYKVLTVHLFGRFRALRCGNPAQLAEGLALTAGNQWAERASYLLFTNMNSVSVEQTMVSGFSLPTVDPSHSVFSLWPAHRCMPAFSGLFMLNC